MKALFVLALSLVLVSLQPSESLAGSLQPSRVSELQPASPPEGARQLCRNYHWACSASAAASLGAEGQIQAAARDVNLAVNRQIRPQRDSDNYGMAEKWTLPAGNRGDCEDYALLKKKLLIERGVPAERLLLTVVIKDSLEPHVVLLFRGEETDYLLDNMTDAMLPWHLTGYTVVKMQSAANKTLWSAVLLGPLATRELGRNKMAGQAVDQIAANSTQQTVAFAAGRRHY